MRRIYLAGIFLLLVSISGCSAPTESAEVSKPGLNELVPQQGGCSNAENSAGGDLIRAQLQAFKKQDLEGAYGYATESFKENNSLSEFKSVIENQYSMLLDLKSFEILQCAREAEIYYFNLSLIDNTGQNYSMDYALANTDGIWGVIGAQVSMNLN